MEVNIVVISGNLGSDPIIRESGNSRFGSFSIAQTEKGYTTKDGRTIEDHVNWFRCTFSGRQADFIEKYLTKGTAVTVTGKLRQSTYEDKDRNKRESVEIRIQEIKFNSTRREEGSSDNPPPDDLPF